MSSGITHAYEALPRYAPVPGPIYGGWREVMARFPVSCQALAIDGPMIAHWDELRDQVTSHVESLGRTARFIDTRRAFLPWNEVVALTSTAELRDDPDFEFLAAADLGSLLDIDRSVGHGSDGLTVIYGPGAALYPFDAVWYWDLPKRYAEKLVTAGMAGNLGQREGGGTTKRLFYADWPILDKHRNAIARDIDLWLDGQNPDRPVAVTGETLRATLEWLSIRPLRTRPTFNTASWGGQWARRQLGMNRAEPRSALGYELIAPESGLLIGTDRDTLVEVPFDLLVSLYPQAVLGDHVRAQFGTSFPVRFDYLDTVAGGDLSVHCHPEPDYMREVFGWPYTQHESYYMMVTSPDSQVYLGLGQGADIRTFQKEARAAEESGAAFDVTKYVQIHPADEHQLYLIPAGTPHGSGTGNVVLEVSATPYLYSLRFYDWLRRDGGGSLRPVHVDHAFRNLNTNRAGASVTKELIQDPRLHSEGPGWRENVIGALPEMFFEVRRVELAGTQAAESQTGDRFHVICVVEGLGVRVVAEGVEHALNYAETMVVPAAVGRYELHPVGSQPVRVVKALVR